MSFFAGIIDKPKEQHKKQEYSKGGIGKVKLLDGKRKWTNERVDKATDKTINKVYTEYKQCDLNEKGEKTGKTLGKHVIGLYFAGISQMV